MTTNDYRNRYRSIIAEAAGLGWTPADLKREAKPLVRWFMARGESEPEAWCSAATEVVQVEQENRIA